jgi:hypothetical protein
LARPGAAPCPNGSRRRILGRKAFPARSAYIRSRVVQAALVPLSASGSHPGRTTRRREGRMSAQSSGRGDGVGLVQTDGDTLAPYSGNTVSTSGASCFTLCADSRWPRAHARWLERAPAGGTTPLSSTVRRVELSPPPGTTRAAQGLGTPSRVVPTLSSPTATDEQGTLGGSRSVKIERMSPGQVALGREGVSTPPVVVGLGRVWAARLGAG